MVIRFQKGTGTRVSDLSVLWLCLLIAILEIPFLSRNIPNLLIIVLMGAYLLLNIKLFLVLSNKQGVTLLLLLVCILGETLYKALGISSAALYYYFNIFQFFFFIIVMVGTFDALTKKQLKWILSTIIVVVVFTMADNVLLFFRYGPTRYVLLFQTERYTTNAIGTQFVNALIVFEGTTFIWFLRACKRRKTALLLTIAAFLFSAVVAQRAIAIVFSIAQFSLLLLLNHERVTKRFFATFVGLILLGLILLNLNAILSWLGGKVNSFRIARRIRQIQALLSTGSVIDAGGSLSARYRLILTSLKTFTSSIGNFFFGAGDHRTNNTIIGNHSMVIDEFARYGIVGASVMFAMLHQSFQKIRTSTGIKKMLVLRRQVNGVLLISILHAMVGGLIDPLIGIQLFLFLPIMAKLICEEYETGSIGQSDLKGVA